MCDVDIVNYNNYLNENRKKLVNTSYQYRKLLSYLNYKNKKTYMCKNYEDLKIYKACEDNFIVDGKKYHEMMINKNLMHTSKIKKNYKMMIYTKNKAKELNDKKDIVLKLIDKANINILEFVDLNFTKTRVSNVISYNVIEDVLGVKLRENEELNHYIKNNYNKIIGEIFKKMNMKQSYIVDTFTDYLFNESTLYYRKFVDVFVNGVDRMMKSKGLTINYKILKYIMENVFFYKNEDTFGTLYQSITHIANRLHVSRLSVLSTIRRLEYVGILDGVVGNTIKVGQYVQSYVSGLKNILLKDQFEQNKEVQNYRRYFIYPVMNFKTLLNYIPNAFIKTLFKSILYEIKLNISEKIIDRFVSYLYQDFKKDDIRDILSKDSMIQQLMTEKKKRTNVALEFNYHEFFKNKFKHVGDEVFSHTIVDDSCFDYYKNRSNKLNNLGNIMDDYFMVSRWLGDNLKLFYEQQTGKKIKVLNYKLMHKFISDNAEAFEQFETKMFGDRLTKIYDVDNSYEHNLKKLYKSLLDNHKLSLIETIKMNTKMRCNTFKVIKDDKLKEYMRCNMKQSNVKLYKFYYLVHLLNSNKSCVTSRFGLYDIIGKKFLNANDKVGYFKKIYDTFIRVNKHPITVVDKLVNLLME